MSPSRTLGEARTPGARVEGGAAAIEDGREGVGLEGRVADVREEHAAVAVRSACAQVARDKRPAEPGVARLSWPPQTAGTVGKARTVGD